VIKNDLLHLFLHLLLLTQDCTAFLFDSTRVQSTVLEDIGQNINSLSHILFEAASKVDRLFTGGVGIQLSPQILDFTFQLDFGTAFSSLEMDSVGRGESDDGHDMRDMVIRGSRTISRKQRERRNRGNGK
jgi:hypothetical protein